MIHMKRRPLIFGLLLIACIAACTAEQGSKTQLRGTLQLPLYTSTSEYTYRLVNAQVVVDGPESLAVQPNPDDEFLTLSVAAGTYTVTLLDGYQLQRVDQSNNTTTMEDVVLTSQNPITIDVVNQEIYPLTFSFDVSGTGIEFGDGGIQIGIEVCDTPGGCEQSACEPEQMVTRYRDGDGDSYGDPNDIDAVCPATPGWVLNGDDCDDFDNTVYPNAASFCEADQMTRQRCPSSGGLFETSNCDQGCFEGACRTDGTIGIPGYVSCSQTEPLTHCPSSMGCDAYETTCGTEQDPGTVRCDGPNDCPGQVCCAMAGSFSLNTACYDTCPSNQQEVCDPLANSCLCTLFRTSGEVGFYVCP